jgi:hypothetical protein
VDVVVGKHRPVVAHGRLFKMNYEGWFAGCLYRVNFVETSERRGQQETEKGLRKK